LGEQTNSRKAKPVKKSKCQKANNSRKISELWQNMQNSQNHRVAKQNSKNISNIILNKNLIEVFFKVQYKEIVSSNKEPFQKLVCLFLRIRVDCFTQFVIWLFFALPCMHLQTQSCNRTTFFFNCKNNFQLNITFLGFKELINSN